MLIIKTIMSDVNIVQGLRIVRERIQSASQKTASQIQPRLVAVTKTKAKELIIEAYENEQRNFGENYVQELIDKAYDTEILEKCPEIKWHFIGHLQRNKINKIVSIPGLFIVETVDTGKLAMALDSAWVKEKGSGQKLKIMAQINTSGEEGKNGCTPGEATQFVKYILDNCINLDLIGFMTIGKFGYDLSQGPNPDFICLKEVRDKVCNDIGLDSHNFELSMGMSDDFEHAIEMGSTNVRVGSSIFGYRKMKPSSKDVDAV